MIADEVITITKLAFGGSGIGHLEGKVCFVPFTLPGDKVRIRVMCNKKSHLFGEIVELVEPSPHRTTPVCPVFGSCGGCDWQHISYDQQLAAKRLIVQEALGRALRLAPDKVDMPVPSEATLGYRSRVQFKIRFVAGKLHLGFYRAESHFVINLPGGCLLAHPSINALIPALRNLILALPDPDKVPQVDCETSEDGSVLMVIHYIGSDRRKIKEILREQADGLGVAGLFIQFGRKADIETISGLDSISYTVPPSLVQSLQPLILSTRRGGFSQVNTPQNKAIIRMIAEWCDAVPGSALLDLYCGNGNLSLPVAHKFSSVLGMEAFSDSIKDAQSNMARNCITNAEYRAVDAVIGARELRSRGQTFDTIILDPPRTGAADLVREITPLAKRQLIYVSCDPATLGRDLGYLQNDFEVVRVVPVDMFPQTYHIESVTLLRRREKV